MSEAAVPEVGPAEASERIRAGAQLLDVRTKKEFREARIPGSKLIELDELMNRAGELDRDREIVVQCKSGGRSARAAAWLNREGYSAVNLAGGIEEWSKQGLPVEPGNPEEE